MARSIIQTKSIVADDFTEIESKTQLLLDRYNISDVQLHSFDIEAFGGQKFLITIFFKDSYVNSALIGFVSILLPVVITKGAKLLKTGLKVVFSNLYGMTRGLATNAGLTCSVETVEGP